MIAAWRANIRYCIGIFHNYTILPIFVTAEWATLLVDIRCPRGGS